MEQHFHSHSNFHSASPEGDEETLGTKAAAPENTWPLASQINQLLGDDSVLDPLFFEESWTLGLDAAVQHCQQKRDESVAREEQSRAFRELDTFGTLLFARCAVPPASFMREAGFETAARCYDADWLRESPANTTSRTNHLDHPGSQSCVTSTREHVSRQAMLYPMTEHHARQLLGVSKASSETQIKAAYRRMAGQWHPDRVEHSSEETLRFATEQMAAINEAYFLLRNGGE